MSSCKRRVLTHTFDIVPCVWHKHRLIGYKMCLMCPLGRKQHTLQAVCTHRRTQTSGWMIGQARHTSASVVSVCQTEVEANASVRLTVKCCQVVDSHVSACVLPAIVPISQTHKGQWLVYRPPGGKAYTLTSRIVLFTFSLDIYENIPGS